MIPHAKHADHLRAMGDGPPSPALPHLDFDLDLFRANLRQVNPAAPTIDVSVRTGHGVDEWCEWVLGCVDRARPEPVDSRA